NFDTTRLGLELDMLRAATFKAAQLSAARLMKLMNPSAAGLPAFLAAETGDSGMLISEYDAADKLGDMQSLATPDSLKTAVLSCAVEDYASFSSHAARHAVATIPAYEKLIACELVAATRALRLNNYLAAKGPLHEVFAKATKAADPNMSDRVIGGDIEAARAC